MGRLKPLTLLAQFTRRPIRTVVEVSRFWRVHRAIERARTTGVITGSFVVDYPFDVTPLSAVLVKDATIRASRHFNPDWPLLITRGGCRGHVFRDCKLFANGTLLGDQAEAPSWQV